MEKCEHRLIILSTKKQPHIRACTKCFVYSPKPHPDVSEKEIHALIEFATAAFANSTHDKVHHVRKARQTRSHHCHWRGCDRQVAPAVWGCVEHWRRLPKYLRNRIWATYRVRQEETMTPSRDYVIAAREVQDWIDAQELL